ncbi:part of a binding-protein-dependent transport system [Arthrobacter sp. Hiyo8]|nr:part of a binding-protein-dependent transport system [Arthrobacter sp. Hiyo8]
MSTVITVPKMGTTDRGQFTVVSARHPWRWVAGTAVGAVVILLLVSAVSNPRFGWDKVALYFRDVAIVNGIGITLFLTVVCMAVGVGLGVVLAVMQLSANPVVKASASAYVTIFRGTPVLVQLLFWFNLSALYPEITFGIPASASTPTRSSHPSPRRSLAWASTRLPTCRRSSGQESSPSIKVKAKLRVPSACPASRPSSG